MRHLSRLLFAPSALRRLASGLGAALVASAALSASAEAVVSTIPTGSGNAVVGLQPRNSENVAGPLETEREEVSHTFSNAEGDPVLPSSNVYAIYWDPKDEYHGDWQSLIDGFLSNLGSASSEFTTVLTVDEQYTDKANEGAGHSTTFRGAYADTEPYPTSENCTDPRPWGPQDRIACLTNSQIQSQLEHFIGTHDLQKGMGSIFYLLTPPGVAVCVDGGGPTGHCSDAKAGSAESYANSFCSYHSDISPTNQVDGDANTILYAVIPWTAGGLADHNLDPEDQSPAFDCQDGGFDPTSHPTIERREKAHERNTSEEEAYGKMSLEEQLAVREREAREGPHQEEPNQPIDHNGPDGWPDTGLADLIINQIAVEQQNTITDPLLNAWQDSSHNETTDECRNFFAPAPGGSVTALEATDAGTLFNQVYGEGHYYLNSAFNLAALKLPYPGPALPCLLGIRQAPSFTAPDTVNAGDLVGFNGMESDITLDAGTRFSKADEEQVAYPLFTWNFGDGTPTVTGYAPGGPTLNSPSAFTCNSPWLEPCAGSTFHAYQYGGTYEVTLTATDVAGNTVTVTREVKVNGPRPPAPPSGGGSGEGSNGSGSSSSNIAPSLTGSSSGGGAPSAAKPGPPPLPGPVAQAVASDRSLPQALRRGLLVNYSVNEQVAGHFEVLLNSQTAHRLGIKGPLAAGLPAGTPQSLVIGQAILVTTKGGHSSVRIKFSKRTAKQLRRVSKVSLTLRLVVRNAAAQNPQSTTVLSTFVLRR